MGGFFLVKNAGRKLLNAPAVEKKLKERDGRRQ
jgi:hypothetical protein